ncbi:unnamed protein product [Lepeophtheirus salmonis]|uniref:(salmon louse) hypothetical protein n=1 Tax=Lepeophtheirus salmonis TaxID=72036 RepID=A0A7R8CMT7_LEPSM|nr:unnamed protein product [Lepeophtheirus salmonis]CAF2867089.1 unnamed protein product [Lepeophtheirus salmonis]
MTLQYVPKVRDAKFLATVRISYIYNIFEGTVLEYNGDLSPLSVKEIADNQRPVTWVPCQDNVVLESQPFLASTMGPLSTPDCKPLDSGIRASVEQKTYATPHSSVEHFKAPGLRPCNCIHR